MDKIMDNTQKQQQVTDFTTSLANIVLKMEQNETDAGNDVGMTTPPYIVRQELTLLRRQVSTFISAELPNLTKEQDDSRDLYTWDKFKINGVDISQEDGFHLSILRWNLQDVVKSTIERFNQHLINLRPRSYPHIPTAIENI